MLRFCEECNSFPQNEERAILENPSPDTGLPFLIDGCCVGIILPNVLAQIIKHPDIFTISISAVELSQNLYSFDDRTAAVDKILQEWRKESLFPALKGWRNEKYSVWGNNHSILMSIERSAAPLFSIRSFGTHINGFVKDPESNDISMWIATRSLTKQTNPGMLDNLAAGGLPHGSYPTENAIKECFEEAGLRIHDKNPLLPVSLISFFANESPIRGLIPDTEFIYDIELPSDWVPNPQDGEVSGFELKPIKEVQQLLEAGMFTKEAGLCVVDFLVRHSLMEPSICKDFVDIVISLRRKLPFPSPAFHF